MDYHNNITIVDFIITSTKLYVLVVTLTINNNIRFLGNIKQGCAKSGAIRTKSLASLYWSSQSLHLKKLANQISHRSTKVDPIRWS